jgi:hypothetical protein
LPYDLGVRISVNSGRETRDPRLFLSKLFHFFGDSVPEDL